MNESAYEQLIDRLVGVDGPASAIADLILAAAEGPDALDAHLAGGPAPERREPTGAGEPAAPARVYLEQIGVENFRGIGPGARLQLAAGPGLTLVVGRNGSGKSSFAEGLELLLTGSNLRWEDRTRVWREGWRNLHGDGPAVLSARFRADGEAQPLELRRRWPAEATLDAGNPIEVSGPRDSWEALGWEAPLSRYRPLLSYNELGTMFSERASALYEALSAVLGLHDFDTLAATLREARLAREKTGKAEKQERAQLKARLEASPDDRGAAIAALLTKRAPDVDAIETIVAGDDPGPSATALQPLAGFALPDEATLERGFDALGLALSEVRRLEATDAERLDALARLLEQAISFHRAHGEDRTCPVCGTEDVLDPDWTRRSESEVQELRRQSEQLRNARTDLAVARKALGTLFGIGLPAALRAAAPELDAGDAQDAWDAWAAALAADDDTLVREGPATGELLRLAAQALREAAASELARRDAAWRPTRDAVRAWVAIARRADADKAAVARLKEAEGWMGTCVAQLRRERLRPVIESAQANWAQLRHESNVSLGEVELRKEGNRRYASFDVTVDGTASSAFGVMSQGELSALAVSVFLPRASLPESPFGFMVIDDPVQSMDPAKVDGLARVLAHAAETRQVIVFTHDERLSEAVRRLDIDARIMRVLRRAASKIEVVASPPPSDRYVGEAFAFAKNPDVPEEVRARVLPGLCRAAIEAACIGQLRRRLIESGTPHAEVETWLAEDRSLTAWLAEVFRLSVAQGAEITDRVRRLGGDAAVETVSIVRRGAHRLVAADGLRLSEGTKSLVRELERG
jgi:AAA domain/AAA domain, putative AbiEii toxin, Type IV TA system